MISAVLAQTSRTIATGILLVGMSLAQQTSQEPAQPALQVQTDLVVVPFQVRLGSRSVSDLKPSDVVLLEDGVPRAFTGFEAPPDHPSLELVVMFDVTDLWRGGFWSAKALHDLASFWNETMARALLEESGATIRISIYQFDQSRLRRLCRSTSDPKVLLDALQRLSDPIPADEALQLTVPAGTVIRAEQQRRLTETVMNGTPWPLSLAGAITALRDSAVGPAIAARALVIFSPGAEGTSITPEDLAYQAVAANVPVYPVALPSTQAIWYEGDNPNIEFINLGASGPAAVVVPRETQFLERWGICNDVPRRGRPFLESEVSDCPLNASFKHVGNQTGGRSFEAARRPGPKLSQSGEGPLDRFYG